MVCSCRSCILVILCHSLSFFILCVLAELGAGCRLRPLQFPSFVDPGGWWRLQHLEHSDGHCQPVVNASTCCIHRLLGPGEGVRRSGL
jgi:hypothetical protein